MNDLPHDPHAADSLERLLDLAGDVALPRDLTARVLAGLERREERALDALLDLDAAPPAPTDLAARVLAAVAAEERARRRFRWLPGGTLPRVAAAAAVLCLSFGGWRLAVRAIAPAADSGALATVAEAPAGLLELLPVLERWELLEEGALGSELESADIETLALFGGDDELLMLLALEENG